MRTRSVACVIPAYNAAFTLPSVIAGIRNAVPGARIFVVNDGSADETQRIGSGHADECLRIDRNRGKGAALRAGFSRALRDGADAVLCIDADGQHDPRYAPLLVAALDSADLVLGVRQRSGVMPWARRLSNTLASAAVSFCASRRLRDSQSGFRAMRAAVLRDVHAQGDRYEFETDFLIRAARANFRIAEVAVPTLYPGTPSFFETRRDSLRIARTIWRFRSIGGR